MSKIITGTVVSSNMQDTIVVEVTRRTPHPKYRKLVKHTKRYKVAEGNRKITIGDIVQIVQTKPLAKDKHFRLMEEGKKK